MEKIVLRGRLVVPAEEMDAVLQALPEHIALSRNEPGCLKFEVSRCEQQSNTLEVYEEFVNKAAFEAHQQRTQASAWARVSVNAKREYVLG